MNYENFIKRKEKVYSESGFEIADKFQENAQLSLI